MRCDVRVCTSFVTGALTATTVTIFLLRVLPGTYVVLPCDPTITARPVVLDEYLDRFDLPPQQHLDLGPQLQRHHDLRALHIELGPQQPPHDPGPQHVDLGFQNPDSRLQYVNLQPEPHDPRPHHNDPGPQRQEVAPWQFDVGPNRFDLSQKDGRRQFSAVPQGLQLQLHQLLLREQRGKGPAVDLQQNHQQQGQQQQQHQAPAPQQLQQQQQQQVPGATQQAKDTGVLTHRLAPSRTPPRPHHHIHQQQQQQQQTKKT